MEHDPTHTDQPFPDKPVFCIACGKMLEDFCFSHEADDMEALKRKLAVCKEMGKFTGGQCALLFIANPEEPL